MRVQPCLRIGSERVRCDGGGGGIGHGGIEDDEQKNRDYVYVLIVLLFFTWTPSVRPSVPPSVCLYISGHIKKNGHRLTQNQCGQSSLQKKMKRTTDQHACISHKIIEYQGHPNR